MFGLGLTPDVLVSCFKPRQFQDASAVYNQLFVMFISSIEQINFGSRTVVLLIGTFIKRHICLQKAAEALVTYWSDGLVTAVKQECLKLSFKTMFGIAQHDFCIGRLFQMTGAA